MPDLTRQQALQEIQKLLEQQDDYLIEFILNRIYEKLEIDDYVNITDTLQDPTEFRYDKQKLIQEAIRLLEMPDKPEYLVSRFKAVYMLLEDLAELELSEEASYEEIDALVDSWIEESK